MAEVPPNTAQSGTSPEAPKTRPAHQFQPGQSGNPGGRPKGLERMVREMVDWKKATEVLTSILYGQLSTACSVRDRIKAYEILAARGYGQPKQVINMEDGNRGHDAAGRTTEQLLAARAQLRALLDGVTPDMRVDQIGTAPALPAATPAGDPVDPITELG